MKIKQLLIYLYCIPLLTQCNSAFCQSGYTNQYGGSAARNYEPVPVGPNGSPETEPGKCYQKSIVPVKMENEYRSLPIYIGSDEEADRAYLKKVSFEVSEANTKWIRKKADQNCMSSNPEDCMIWCLVEEPAEVYTYIVVADTNQLKSFYMEEVLSQRIQKKGGSTEWYEVICKDDVTPYFINQLCKNLLAYGFTEECSGIYDSSMKAALSRFQEENGLPVGTLNLITLEYLGVGY